MHIPHTLDPSCRWENTLHGKLIARKSKDCNEDFPVFLFVDYVCLDFVIMSCSNPCYCLYLSAVMLSN